MDLSALRSHLPPLTAWSVDVALVKDDLIIVSLITSLRIGHFLLEAWVTSQKDSLDVTLGQAIDGWSAGVAI
jgi:hypothetical protein